MDLNYSAGSEDSSYKQVFASLKNEVEVISVFLTKLKDEDERKTIQYAASLDGTMDKDVKEAIKSAETIIKKFEHLDEVNASSDSSQGCEEDFPTDQTFRNMRSSYITQVEEVLKVVHSVGGLTRQRVNAEDSSTDWSDTSSETDSMSDMQKRLEALRMMDSLAEAQTERVDAAEVSLIQLEGVPKRFNYDELFMATRGFSEKLGDGGFGTVYRGMLPGGIPVAVKRMNRVVSIHGQGMKEFKSEVSVISQLRHRNLIELRGWCEDPAKKEYMLVYDLMPNGSLDKLMFNIMKSTDPVEPGGAQGRTEGREAEGAKRDGEGRPVKGKSSLSWPQRFKILSTAADALDYLHQGWKHQVIHGDIKCANILLDKEWNAKLIDFGLSRLVDHEGEAYTVHFAGTKGYAAPELFTEGKYTDKSDVFAFGVVVLEVVCGRRNWPSHACEKSLVEWVKERLRKDDVMSTVDKELTGCDREQVETVLMIGLACCDIDHRKRPSMTLVVKMLAGERQAELNRMVMSFLKDKGNGVAEQRVEEDELPRGSVDVTKTVKSMTTAIRLQLQFYHYSDLKAATRDFDPANILWRDDSGVVFKGILPNETTVAVKRLFANCKDLQNEILNEALLSTHIHHRNLVDLRGCCIMGKQRMLIYEYVENGNLAQALWGSETYGTLNWEQRFNICVGVACGLSYLHEEFQPSIIHGNIKPDYILLDGNYKAKITDFGVAKYFLDESSNIRFNMFAERAGYPGSNSFKREKYSMQVQLSDKADVYSYGILVLKVVSGRSRIGHFVPSEESFFRHWVYRNQKEGRSIEVLDPELRDNCVTLEVIRAIKIGLLCSHSDPEKRPSMSQVVTMFLGTMEVPFEESDYS